MEFIVPQFIEREQKVVGPFTFKQFIFIGIAGGLLIFLYFIVPFSLFFIISIFLVGGALALAFLKMEGTPLPALIKNAFNFLSRPRVYLWRKKTIPPKIFSKAEKPEEENAEEKKGLALKVVEKSRLRELFTFLETRNK